MTCEKCWCDAYWKGLATGKTQGACYMELIVERAGNPCSEKEQAGQYWDDERQVDKRKVK